MNCFHCCNVTNFIKTIHHSKKQENIQVNNANQKQKQVTFNLLVKEPSHITKHSIHTKLQIEYRTDNSIQNHLKLKYPTGRERKCRESYVYQLACAACKKKTNSSDRKKF